MNPSTEITKTNSNFMNLIRFGAAWLVLVGHSFSIYGFTIFAEQNYFPYIQRIGLVILFIISGFFTTFSLERNLSKREYTYREFFIDRFSRIGSAYYPALVFCLIVDTVYISMSNTAPYEFFSDYNVKSFIGNMFMLQKFPYFEIESFGSARPFWSLTAEWWIYVAYGYLMLKMVKKGNREGTLKVHNVAIFLLLSICPIYFSDRYFGSMLFPFILGVMIFYFYKRIKIGKVESIAAFVVFFAGLIWYGCYKKDCFQYEFMFLCALVILSVLLIGEKFVFFTDKTKPLEKIISFFSGYTYSLYLVHYSIIVFIKGVDMPISDKAKFWLGIVVSNAVAVAFYYLFEKRGKFIGNQLKKVFMKEVV